MQTQHKSTLIFVLFSAVMLGPEAVLAAISANGTPTTYTAISQEHINKLADMHAEAEEHIIKNDFQAAIQTYNEILLVEPDDETAYTGLGQVHMILGEFGKAREAYLNALHINPDNETALRGLQKIVDPDSLVVTEEEIAPPSPTAASKESVKKINGQIMDAIHTFGIPDAPAPEATKAEPTQPTTEAPTAADSSVLPPQNPTTPKPIEKKVIQTHFRALKRIKSGPLESAPAKTALPFPDGEQILDQVVAEPESTKTATPIALKPMITPKLKMAKSTSPTVLKPIIAPEPQVLKVTKAAVSAPITEPKSMNTSKETVLPPAAPLVKDASTDYTLGAKKSMAPYSSPVLKIMEVFTREQLIQMALKNAGFYGGSIDGVLGPASARAIRQFQSQHDLAVDGRVGPNTWAALQPYLNKNSFEEKSVKKI